MRHSYASEGTGQPGHLWRFSSISTASRSTRSRKAPVVRVC